MKKGIKRFLLGTVFAAIVIALYSFFKGQQELSSLTRFDENNLSAD